jgi:hypothetical protein
MGAEAPIMPVFQYFGWVGSFLLAALLAANWCFPAPIAPQADVPLDQKVRIRIHTDHKWPDRVVLDTTRATLAHDAKADGETDLAGSEIALLTKPQPFEAFAEMAPPQGRAFDRRATLRGAEQEPSPIEKGVPLQNRSRLSMMARKGFTLPSPPRTPPGRS